MKANELRIGNWVNEFGIPKQVTPNLILKLYQIEIAGKVAIDISPIPLTPEILVKAGFDRVKNKYQDNYVVSFSNWDFYSVQEREGIFYFSNDKSDAGCYVITRVDFVHKLQNLLYELSGKELNIDLNIKIPEFPKDRIGQWKGGA